MRIWVDLTNSPHVLVLRPIIDVLRARGADVRVTARDFAQTVQLCERLGDELGLDATQPIAVVRTPPSVSLYHRFENDLFARVLNRLRGTQTVVLPRVAAQRTQLDGFVVPERAIDAQSLIAFADVVVSAGGTMNREAVALGTPVWTTFEGRLGAVDERLIAEGRLKRLERADDLVLEKRSASSAERVRRDPAVLADLLCAPPPLAAPA